MRVTLVRFIWIALCMNYTAVSTLDHILRIFLGMNTREKSDLKKLEVNLRANKPAISLPDPLPPYFLDLEASDLYGKILNKWG